jgi:hypothetical protein
MYDALGLMFDGSVYVIHTKLKRTVLKEREKENSIYSNQRVERVETSRPFHNCMMFPAARARHVTFPHQTTPTRASASLKFFSFSFCFYALL